MSVYLEKRGRRITVTSSEPLPGLKSTIPGAYQTVSGAWTVPLSIESCKLLRGKYGQRLRIGTELRRWAKGVQDSRAYMAELAASEDAELEYLPEAAPRLARAMSRRKYQRVGVRYIADNPSTLVADEPGLGKTLMAMGGILEAQIPGPYLVVAPKTAADSVWRREITRWLPDEHRAIILPDLWYDRDRKIRLSRYGKHTWLIVHPEIVLVQAWWLCECGKRTVQTNHQQRTLDCGHVRDRKTKKITEPRYPKIFDIEWGAIIVDESHESLIRRKGTPTQRRRGLDMLRVRADGIKLAMSGTPFDSKPHQLWGTLNWLDSGQYSAFHRWAELYWEKGSKSNFFQIGEFREDREKMLWDSLSAIALRRTKIEVAKDLPPKIYVGSPLEPSDEDSPVGIWLEMEDKQADAYAQMEATSVAELESGRLEAITALAELTRLKQLACSYGKLEYKLVRVRDPDTREWNTENKQIYTPELPSNKFKWTVEMLEEWGYPDRPLTGVVIVSFFTGILTTFGAGIEKHFKTKENSPLCTAITGRTPSKHRRAIIDRYNSAPKGSPRVMLLNVKAGGTAITLDSADHTIFISETRIPDQQLQAEDRTHRISNPRQCLYFYLRSLGTVDVGTALVNQEASRATHRLLDQRRGVDYMRQVLDLSRGPAQRP